MRIPTAIMLAVFPIAASSADLFFTPSANSGIVPRQMPDGSKTFTFATQWPLKFPGGTQSDPEAVLIDLLAQSLAKANWCSNGWEIANRSEPLKGTLYVEGRCK